MKDMTVCKTNQIKNRIKFVQQSNDVLNQVSQTDRILNNKQKIDNQSKSQWKSGTKPIPTVQIQPLDIQSAIKPPLTPRMS